MLVLGLDLETTGVDVINDSIVEVGAVLWDVEAGIPVKVLSEFVDIRPKEIPPEITKITGIEQRYLDQWGKPIEQVMNTLVEMEQKAQYIVAHNGINFDKIILDRFVQHHPEHRFDIPWIDTMTDLPFAEGLKTRKLSYLAAEHGFLNPFSHRAIFDVLTMMKIFSFYKFDDILTLQKSELVKVIAKVTFDERDKARDNGFRWDRNARQWFMEIKKIQLEQKKFPFEIAVELI